jgi:hypothetical protein
MAGSPQQQIGVIHQTKAEKYFLFDIEGGNRSDN